MFSSLILVSTSIYRKKLLEKLGHPFKVQKPLVNESQIKSDHMNLEKTDLTLLLAQKKAESLAEKNFGSILIASDQMAVFKDKILDKPKNFEKSFEQLQKLQGQTHSLITSLWIQHENKNYTHVDVTEMHMRSLTNSEIKSYLKKDKPFNCAGSYKFESEGWKLFEFVNTQDPHTIIGLPLLKLHCILKKII